VPGTSSDGFERGRSEGTVFGKPIGRAHRPHSNEKWKWLFVNICEFKNAISCFDGFFFFNSLPWWDGYIAVLWDRAEN